MKSGKHLRQPVFSIDLQQTRTGSCESEMVCCAPPSTEFSLPPTGKQSSLDEMETPSAPVLHPLLRLSRKGTELLWCCSDEAPAGSHLPGIGIPCEARLTALNQTSCFETSKRGRISNTARMTVGLWSEACMLNGYRFIQKIIIKLHKVN